MENKKASKVYFTDLHVKDKNLLEKLEMLITAAGIDQIDFQDKYVAIKMHMGEPGNLSIIRQQYVKVLVDHIKARGGKPFVTDANTLYPGYRNNALGHLEAAALNGFTPQTIGAQIIIADGLRGTDEREILVEGGKYCKTAKIAAAIAEADIVISMSHFKGHVSTGFGGALKNIGMGAGSKHGKMEMHSEGTPVINTERCVGCGMCIKHCNHNAISVENKKASINTANCVGCGHCFAYCPKGAIDCGWDIAKNVLACKISEYTKAALAGKPNFHISLVMDVSPFCDCGGSNDVPIVPNVGMFASFDPVALDQACVDAVNKLPIIEGSFAYKRLQKYGAQEVEGKPDVFKTSHPSTDGIAGLVHAEKLGLGTRDYELETV